MTKYQKLIQPTVKLNKKPAHEKKNPAAHQTWLNYKKARNAQCKPRKKGNNHA